jgi:hypothetical protein
MLLLSGCSSRLALDRQSPFLWVARDYHSNADPTCSAMLFEHGLVKYGCGSPKLTARLNRAELAKYTALVRTKQWQDLVDSLAAQGTGAPADAPELSIYYRIGAEEHQATILVEEEPASLLPYLEQLDQTLIQVFGRDYETRFAQRRRGVE